MTLHIPALRVERKPDEPAGGHLTRALLDLVGYIPDTDERRSHGPQQRARKIAAAASNRAAIAAGTLALPPGSIGWLTIVPELVAIWRIQRQMVADIAGAYGVSAELTPSHMLYCLFRHAAAQALRDVGVQVGARLLIQDLPLRVIERVSTKIGLGVSRRIAGRGITRWLPVLGAIGVGAYAHYDTGQVARTAIALFGGDAPRARRAKRARRSRAAATRKRAKGAGQAAPA